MSNCEDASRVFTAMITTAGMRAATEAFGVIIAVTRAQTTITSASTLARPEPAGPAVAGRSTP